LSTAEGDPIGYIAEHMDPLAIARMRRTYRLWLLEELRHGEAAEIDWILAGIRTCNQALRRSLGGASRGRGDKGAAL
jgi:hypothetical protein